MYTAEIKVSKCLWLLSWKPAHLNALVYHRIIVLLFEVRKYGIDIGIAYNKPEKNKNRVPVCPKEKELAIMDALKAFRMLTEDTEFMEVSV